MLEQLNNSYFFLRECDSPYCALTRTKERGCRDVFLENVQEEYFDVLAGISESSNNGEGIDLAFLGSGGLLFEALIIEAMIEKGVKISSVSLIDKHYKNIMSDIKKNSNKYFDVSSASFIASNPTYQERIMFTLNFIKDNNLEAPSTIISSRDLQALNDWSYRVILRRLMQFRNYITKNDQKPRVVIFDSEEAFTSSKKEPHLLISVDLFSPDIRNDPTEFIPLYESLERLSSQSLFTAILWDSGNKIIEQNIVLKYDKPVPYKVLKTKTYTSCE